MTQMDLLDQGSPFDTIRRTDTSGEWWSARELMPLLGYNRWENFAVSIKRAALAARNSGSEAESHFRDATKIAPNAQGVQRSVSDYRLTRYGAYLTAMNGDPRKTEIAQAQTYFAVKTREAEVRDEPDELEQALRHVRAIEEKRAAIVRAEKAEEIVYALTPKAEQADFHRSADGLVPVGDFANKLKAWAKETHNVRVIHPEVWDFLAEIRLVIRGEKIRNNRPTAFATDRGFIKVKETEYVDSQGVAHVSVSSRLTPAGEGWAWDRAVRRIAEHGSLRPLTSMEVAS